MNQPDLQAAAAPDTRSAASVVAGPARQLATACPRCGAAVPSEASDFCEGCSAHLYPGHCVFCLEPFASGQAFCRQCGLPPEGVVCGACGTFSRFDFCPNPDCGAGLTPRAAAELSRLEQDTEAVEAFRELDEIGVVLAELEGGQGGRGGQEMMIAATASPTPSAAPRPSLKALRAAAAGAKSAEDRARVRALAEQAAQESLNAVSTRSFPSAQEARAAGSALQVALRFRVVSERLEVIAWRCNAFNCVHPMPGGMAQCSDPSRGGVPLTRVITEVNEGSAEFSA
jgi:Double zinc ribbon